MTTVVCWLNEELGEKRLWAVSDTRISRGTQQQPRGNVSYSTLLDSGAKLFPLYIKCKKLDNSSFFDQVYFEHSIGMAYAGSSLIGLNLYATLVNILNNLMTLDRDAIPPSLSDIAHLVANLLKRMISEVGIIDPKGAICELAIFGFCHITSQFKIIHLYPEINPKLEIVVSDRCLVDNNYLLLLGDKKEHIRELINQRRAEIVEKNILWWRSPKEVIEKIVNENKFETIGGAIPACIAAESGFQLYASVLPVIQGSPHATMFYQNIDFRELGNIGNCFIGISGMI